ncbi:hypothetical protein RhiirA4_550644 [Rhizophagus irregularis]|uniref:Uncharacterized protein n=1 Tax=Rhizophagus irregularis TaxID=588596 RepID=A0A2I1HNF4_9GLOM|nr:hypothetical protein RhiirA4_550644 [Rhizophagus irregularis]
MEVFLSIFQIVLLEIYKFFVSECSNIRYLDLGEVRHPFPGAEICLLNLNEVDYYIEFKYDNIGLAKLIKTQKRIKYIKVEDITNEEREKDDIIKALEEYANLIIYLNLSMQKTFSYLLFPKFVNLQTLKECMYESEIIEKNLTAAIYPKLQILELEYMSIHIAIKIIQNTGGNLWEIKIRTIKITHSREYIQAIYKIVHT